MFHRVPNSAYTEVHRRRVIFDLFIECLGDDFFERVVVFFGRSFASGRGASGGSSAGGSSASAGATGAGAASGSSGSVGSCI